jgi:hypothetical protein
MVNKMTDAGDIAIYLPELERIWQESTGEAEIKVAIIDGPVDLSHPCFKGAALTPSEAFISRNNNAPIFNHGTNSASIIFGQHGTSIRGISPGSRGLIVPVYSDGPLFSYSQIDIARAIMQSLEFGANVIGITGGEIDSSGRIDPLLEKAIHLCSENGVLVFAAARNGGCRCIHLPAAISSTEALKSMHLIKGILTSAETIMVAEPGGGLAVKSSRLFVTPIITGIAALLLSIQKKRCGKLDYHLVLEVILQKAPSGSTLDVAGAFGNIMGKIK